MDLICFQGKDEENYSQLNALIKKGGWERVFMVRNKEATNVEFGEIVIIVGVDSSKSLIELKEEILKKLKVDLGKKLEVGLSIASGTGKEHMALISALLSIPVGIRLVAFTKKGVEFIN